MAHCMEHGSLLRKLHHDIACYCPSETEIKELAQAHSNLTQAIDNKYKMAMHIHTYRFPRRKIYDSELQDDEETQYKIIAYAKPEVCDLRTQNLHRRTCSDNDDQRSVKYRLKLKGSDTITQQTSCVTRSLLTAQKAPKDQSICHTMNMKTEQDVPINHHKRTHTQLSQLYESGNFSGEEVSESINMISIPSSKIRGSSKTKGYFEKSYDKAIHLNVAEAYRAKKRPTYTHERTASQQSFGALSKANSQWLERPHKERTDRPSYDTSAKRPENGNGRISLEPSCRPPAGSQYEHQRLNTQNNQHTQHSRISSKVFMGEQQSILGNQLTNKAHFYKVNKPEPKKINVSFVKRVGDKENIKKFEATVGKGVPNNGPKTALSVKINEIVGRIRNSGKKEVTMIRLGHSKSKSKSKETSKAKVIDRLGHRRTESAFQKGSQNRSQFDY